MGKLADLVILDRDPRAVSDASLSEVVVDATVLAGKVVFERADS